MAVKGALAPGTRNEIGTMTVLSSGSVMVMLVSALDPVLVTKPVKLTLWPASMACGLQWLTIPTDGRFVSSTVTVWLQVLLLLHASMAAQVRVAMKLFPHNGFVKVFRITIRFVPQASAGATGA